MSRERGVLGSSTPWTYLAIGLYGARLLRRMARREEETVAVEALSAGESLIIRAIPAKQAKAEAAAERLARTQAGRRRGRAARS
jgi:hypothetical protein